MKNNQSNLTNYLHCSYILERQKEKTEHETKLGLSGGLYFYIPNPVKQSNNIQIEITNKQIS